MGRITDACVACRLLTDGMDIRIIQLMLGHASIQQTQGYLNVTDEELRKGFGGELGPAASGFPDPPNVIRPAGACCGVHRERVGVPHVEGRDPIALALRELSFSRSEARRPAESRPLGSPESRRTSSSRQTAPG